MTTQLDATHAGEGDFVRYDGVTVVLSEYVPLDKNRLEYFVPASKVQAFLEALTTEIPQSERTDQVKLFLASEFGTAPMERTERLTEVFDKIIVTTDLGRYKEAFHVALFGCEPEEDNVRA